MLGPAGGVAWARGGLAGVMSWCLLLGALALGAVALLARLPPVTMAEMAVMPAA